MYAKCVNVSQINVLLYNGGQELLKVKLPATAGREIWTQSYCCQQRDNNKIQTTTTTTTIGTTTNINNSSLG